MNSEPSTQSLSNGGKPSLITPSTVLLNQKLAISPGPRMLTPSELELLRQSQLEMRQALSQQAQN